MYNVVRSDIYPRMDPESSQDCQNIEGTYVYGLGWAIHSSWDGSRIVRLLNESLDTCTVYHCHPGMVPGMVSSIQGIHYF